MTTALDIRRTPELIAAEINDIKARTRTMLLYNSIEIGRRLSEAKQCLPHGEWGKWLETSVDYSQSTANNLMRIFDEYGADQLALFGETGAKSQALGKLSYTQAVAMLGVPAEEREQFAEEHDIDNLSTRELQRLVKELEQERSDKQKLVDDLSKTKASLDEAESTARVNHELMKSAKFDLNELEQTINKEREYFREELKAAHQSGDAEEVKRLEGLLQESKSELSQIQNKARELEEELRAKPIDVPATIEKIPDHVIQELDQLRASQRSAAEIKFKLEFDSLVKGFNALLGTLGSDIEPDKHPQYQKAVLTLIDKMRERIGEAA